MRYALNIVVALLMATSCGGSNEEFEAGDLAEAVCGGEERVVGITTADDLVLAADLRPGSAEGQGAVVLFHMRPPTYNRSGYPERVRAAIGELGVTVLNVDRRGAGDSEGDPEEAYEGPGGLLDMEAAVRTLLDPALACPVDVDHIVLVGASNGTTSVMDYFVGHDGTLPNPSGLLWMSPGEYTENQSSIADHRTSLEEMPMLWLYPSTEPWALDFVADAPETWTLIERGEEHGTFMFDGGELEDVTLDDIRAFIESHGN